MLYGACVLHVLHDMIDTHKHAQVPEANGGMDIKLKYTGEEFVDVKAWAIMCLLARQIYYGTLLWDTVSLGGTRTWEVSHTRARAHTHTHTQAFIFRSLFVCTYAHTNKYATHVHACMQTMTRHILVTVCVPA